MFGPEADIWAVGTLIQDLAIRQAPFHESPCPKQSASSWFEAQGRQVPPGTTSREDYIDFCFWDARLEMFPKRIDLQYDNKKCEYSKLLNYFMMRALDLNWKTRITAYELQHYLPVLNVSRINCWLRVMEIFWKISTTGATPSGISYAQSLTVRFSWNCSRSLRTSWEKIRI
ncbi:hypothetical protein BCR34DRAFT_597659 [Clohesyomyces aquaticus]|uniref:Protein kinase domain-containing protein n=1 Tax=Clohesyomyces aquaticus TaxID=1231657 RepID=A0A1Y2A2Y7_9PLEO|nr:hypothetical protein BCR34DRAFT_597659 [Clohesyomyces aquaticus]